ncbi:MAG: carboxymuconolactone decarboxylase family protein [Chloroflexia bacterium]|nr:carboxymuconolactone decarboxylase family protein [Chloroflexia bacterium]MDQ3410599.1 carboxymuconolactone decarboxylase family protein [Chloroflexota bacterium]
MTPRLSYRRLAPDTYQKMLDLSAAASSTLEPVLVELVKTRVSQINGCAFCINLHAKALRAAGETEQRINLLNAWRETSLYTDRERAALAWAEAVTRLPNGDVPDEVYDQARSRFSDKELVDLTFVTTTINAWNRLAISFRPAFAADRQESSDESSG